MAFLSEAELPESFAPFGALREKLGFVPNLFRAQTLLPRVIEAEAQIAGAVLFKETALSRTRKECILLAVSAASANRYCVTAHCHVLRSLGMEAGQVERVLADHHSAGLAEADTVLLDFAVKLSQLPTWICREDVDGLRRHGFTDEQILEAVLITGLTDFLCTLSVGLGAEPDFAPPPLPELDSASRLAGGASKVHTHDPGGPYLRAVELTPERFPPFAFFAERFGFVPNIFRAQTLRPDVLEAEAHTVSTVLLSDDVLPRVQKEYILLVVSAANLNTYCVAVHVEMLRNLGIPDDVSDQIAMNHHATGLSPADKALLDFVLKLAQRPLEFCQGDVESLKQHGFSMEQILEAVVMTGLTSFLNTLQMGLGTVPDFEPSRVFPLKELNPPARTAHLMQRDDPARSGQRPGDSTGKEPDEELVARVQAGDLGAFGELVRRQHVRVYRTLVGITGSREDAEDGVQNVFLEALQHIQQFQGKAKFSTWLTRIAINEGVERVRSRKPLTSLDEIGREDDEAFRPRQLRAWEADAEQLYSRAETKALVERAILGLPTKYRVVVLLRDIEQLSTEEAAAALSLQVATMKTRLLRGRMMLREALAPHFQTGRGAAHA